MGSKKRWRSKKFKKLCQSAQRKKRLKKCFYVQSYGVVHRKKRAWIVERARAACNGVAVLDAQQLLAHDNLTLGDKILSECFIGEVVYVEASVLYHLPGGELMVLTMNNRSSGSFF